MQAAGTDLTSLQGRRRPALKLRLCSPHHDERDPSIPFFLLHFPTMATSPSSQETTSGYLNFTKCKIKVLRYQPDQFK